MRRTWLRRAATPPLRRGVVHNRAVHLIAVTGPETSASPGRLRALLLAAFASAFTLAGAAAHPAELIGRAVLPADSFADGPPSGQYDDHGLRLAQPRFATQPVQGISAIKPGPQPDTFWALSDNGYATKWNSPDWRLAIYLFAASPQRKRVSLLRRIALTDPAQKFPWRLANEEVPGRPLTGADIDPESMVAMPDGSFWIGDEFGPWLLHFDAAGRLLAPPVDLPDPRAAHAGQVLRSPQHPLVLAGAATATVAASHGLEGLAMASDGRRLLAMLEGSLAEDPPDELRLFEFDLASERFTSHGWRYRTAEPGLSVGEIARSGDGGLLAIERDSKEGDAARIKRIHRFDEPGAGTPDGTLLPGTLLADLLAIDDPRHLGGGGSVFRYPWVTIESVQALDAHTLLVVNDNNYPATGGRGANVRDFSEWIWLRIAPVAQHRTKH